MTRTIRLEDLLGGCADDSIDDGIRIDTELEPLSGPGAPVKPAVYEGGKYQQDSRWLTPDDDNPTPVVIIDNVPSQANRLEEALRRQRASIQVPEFVLDLSDLGDLPGHLPRRISSWQFPHRNADAYLRDARLADSDFIRTPLGRAVFGSTAQTCATLMSWFPQALLYGFWQSHLGKKRNNSKHARSWVSEIVGWNPGSTETRVMGLKGDPLNLNIDEDIKSNPNDRLVWAFGTRDKEVKAGTKEKLSEIGHGQVPFMGNEATAAAISFSRITQRATVSFAQLRRISLGPSYSGDADEAARAVLVALGLHAHLLAFGRGFALRSGAELRPKSTAVTWLGSDDDDARLIGDNKVTAALLQAAVQHARKVGVPLDGWGKPPVVLTPKENLRKAIRASWPEVDA